MAPHEDGDHEPHQFMTVIEVAVSKRVSRATIYRLTHAGVLPGVRVRKTLRVSRRAVEVYIHDSGTSHRA
jgi:excisionase family DNA binding protein